MPACVFHHPMPVAPGGRSGSSVRPYLMREALADAGFEVVSVTGHAAERDAAMRRVLADLEGGRGYAFAYSESHTLPMPLTDPHHLPLRPELDYGFLAALKRRAVPVGLYYRDVHWLYPELTPGYPAHKRAFVNAFHRREWRRLQRVVDHLFLRSARMAERLPTPWRGATPPLPPGLVPRPRERRRPVGGELRLLYVGGVNPPLYDLDPLLQAVAAAPHVGLTLCCRPEEWARRAYAHAPPNVRVVHASGRDLDPLYDEADAVAVVLRPHDYLGFAMPVKLFEAMAYGLPVVALAGTEAARFVAAEEVGWVVEDAAAFAELTRRLLDRPEALEEAYARVAAARERHTWTARARQVADTLAAVREGAPA